MGNLHNSMAEEVSLRRKYEAPLSMAMLKKSTSLNRRSQPELSGTPDRNRGGSFAR